MEKLKKRKNGYYQASVTVNGKRRFFYGHTSEEAIRRRNDFLSEIEKFPFIDDKITLSEWTAAWLEGIKSTITLNTYQSYKGTLKRHILSVPFGNILLEDLKPAVFRVYWQQMTDKGLSPRTISYVHTLTSAALKQAVADGVIPSNPLDYVRRPKKEPTRAKALSEAQIKLFFEHVHNDVLERICRFAIATGMRRGEILGIRWEDVSFERKTVSVNQTCLAMDGSSAAIVESTKTKNSRRTITVDDGTIDMLRTQKAYCLRLKLLYPGRSCNLVFPSEVYTPLCPDNITRETKAVMRAAGIPQFSFHSFRHTHATLLLERGINYKIIQSRLGHSSCATTMDIYSHVTPQMDSEAAKITSFLYQNAK